MSALVVAYYGCDHNPHRDRSMGLTEYADGLISHMAKRDDVKVCVLESQSSFSFSKPGIQCKRLPMRTDHLLGRVCVDQLHPLMRHFNADTWHYPKGFLPFFIEPQRPAVGTVCDTYIQYYADHYPGNRSRLAYAYWLAVLKRSIARLDAILTLSEYSRRSIETFCDRNKIRPPSITVAYLGIQWENLEPARVTKENYVLHLASRHPHKQTSGLLKLWLELQKSGRDLPELLLVGELPKTERIAFEQLRRARFVPFLNKDELKLTMARARALLFPSEIEGFGMPVVESYYVGTPAVYVQNTTPEEILGLGTPGAFELGSSESLFAGLESSFCMSSEDIHKKAVQLRERFSWNHCVEKTLAVYRQLAGK